MNYNQTLNELYSLDTKKYKLGLNNIKLLLRKLGNPEKQLKCIHVAGTNGKGSVCAMLTSILTNAGYKVGMYTSPHLKRFNERIRINNILITHKEIVDYYLKIKKCNVKCSFFEITTAIAFQYFKDKKVDFTVLETGLGGRLDATNVVKPLISIITNIAVEHTDYLGNNIKKIAYEKAGIIKNNIPTVTAATGIALPTIKSIAQKNNSKLIIINKNNIKLYCNKNNWSFDYNNYKNLKLNLNGTFQIENAIIAIKTLETLKNSKEIFGVQKNLKNFSSTLKINKKNIINGLKTVKWPGRFQFLSKNILIDGAHNISGFKTIRNELQHIDYDKLILVLGFSEDKDIKKISKIFKPNKTILTKSNNIRAVDPIKIKKYFNNPIIINSPKKALKYAKSIANKNDLILITGSIFLVGELI